MTNRLHKKRGRTAKDEKRKFSMNKEHPFIETMSQVYNPYAVKHITSELISEKKHFGCSAVKGKVKILVNKKPNPMSFYSFEFLG